MEQYLAVDLGAESGRVMIATLKSGILTLEEASRFPTPQVTSNDSIRWDFEKLMGNITDGILKAAQKGATPASISCDSWGVDYGWLNAQNELLAMPYAYRDARTDGVMEKVFAEVPRQQVFDSTGIQFMQINTLYHLVAEREGQSMAKASRFLMMADLVNQRLGGRAVTERSLASTSQVFNPRTMDWSWNLVEGLKLRREVFPELVDSGTITGMLTPTLSEKTGWGDVKVVASCSHDTGACVASTPSEDNKGAYLSCGTWSLMGVELEAPLINPAVLQANYTNEVGFGRSIRFLKNIAGLWIVQECRRAWESGGESFTYAELVQRAEAAPAFAGLLNPDHAPFQKPGTMPEKIGNYLIETHQQALTDKGSIIRCALESLALKYRLVLDGLESLTGRKIEVLHMGGGGIQNELLCQFTANAIERPVLAGPVEATAAGNALVQAYALGKLDSLGAMRDVVRRSFPIKRYEPRDTSAWRKAFETFTQLPARSAL